MIPVNIQGSFVAKREFRQQDGKTLFCYNLMTISSDYIQYWSDSDLPLYKVLNFELLLYVKSYVDKSGNARSQYVAKALSFKE